MKTGYETTASIIEALLKEHQLLTMKDIVQKIKLRDEGRTVNDAMANLRYKYAAIGVLDIDGVQYFFLTPETDKRLRKLKERKPEDKPRRRQTKP